MRCLFKLIREIAGNNRLGVLSVESEGNRVNWSIIINRIMQEQSIDLCNDLLFLSNTSFQVRFQFSSGIILCFSILILSVTFVRGLRTF